MKEWITFFGTLKTIGPYVPQELFFSGLPLVWLWAGAIIIFLIITTISLVMAIGGSFIVNMLWNNSLKPKYQEYYDHLSNPPKKLNDLIWKPDKLSEFIQILLSIAFVASSYFWMKDLSENKHSTVGMFFWLLANIIIGLLGKICNRIVILATGLWVSLTTLLSIFKPLFLTPKVIINILYCNRNVIACILTAYITYGTKHNKLLPDNITNVMWGIWGILTCFNILRKIGDLITANRKE